jgi:hypothetical protein
MGEPDRVPSEISEKTVIVTTRAGRICSSSHHTNAAAQQLNDANEAR